MIEWQDKGYPTRAGSMAQLTSLGGYRMGSALTRRDSGVVAVGAGVCGLAVVKWHDHGCPYVCGMTNLALLAGQRMRSGLVSSGTDAVVTPRTVTRLPGHRAVVKQNLQPIGGVMAHIAGLGSGYVSGVFTGGDSAIVAVFTQVSGLAVIKWYGVRLPTGTGGMTSLAQIRGYRMCGGFIGGIGTGMTRCATVRGLVVWKRHDQRYPHIHRMAEFAGIGSLRM